MKLRTMLEAVGTAFLLLRSIFLFLPSSDLFLYRHGLPVTNLIGGLLIDILGVAIMVYGALTGVQYLPAKIQRVAYALFAGFMLWRMADVASILLNNPDLPSYWWEHVRKQTCILMVLVPGIMVAFFPRIAQPAVRAVRLVLAAFAFSTLWIVPQLLRVALVRQPDASAAVDHASECAPGSCNRRIVWILFDELSYAQTFDHPNTGIALPNFERLRTASVSFSNLRPAGLYTERIIPSLFLGRRIEEIRSSVHGDLRYKSDSQSQWTAYDSHSTLFALARQKGWSSGVNGWFNPYCHILAPELDACTWEPDAGFPLEEYGASEDKSILANAAALPIMILDKMTGRSVTPAKVQMREYRDVMAYTHALIENEHVNFIFLHIPVPHPPGIYDRRQHTLRPGGTYLDNLVLADDTLGALLKEIDATPSASRTTLIVSSDHSWRIPLWKPVSGWSAEEERASGGRFDDRPVLLIHFPGQASGKDVYSAEPEMLEHDIVAGMLQGKVNNADDLAGFLARHGG